MRFIMSAGQFTLLPGGVNYVTTAVVWARATSGGQMASVNLLFDADSLAQQVFDSCFVPGILGIDNVEALQSSVSPNPFKLSTTITFKNVAQEAFTLKVFDLNGKVVRRISNI